MHIILLILKIIGILLAVLLGLLFVILITVLFVPLRYRLEGWRRPESGEFAIKGRVSWFLSLISVRLGYEKEAFLQIRLLGIPWKGGGKKKGEGAKEPEQLPRTEGPEEEADIQAKRLPAEESSKEAPVLLKATAIEMAETSDRPEESAKRKVPAGAESPGERDSVKESSGGQESAGDKESVKIFGKIRNILRGLWEKLKGIPDRVRALRERLAGMVESLRQKKEKLDRWLAYLKSEEVKATVHLLWRQTKRLFRHLRPQKVRIRGRFGFGDPALTGQVTGLMSLLPVFYRKELSLHPEFTKACLEGEFFLKGRIRMASLLLLALKIWFNKDFQKVYKHLKAM